MSTNDSTSRQASLKRKNVEYKLEPTKRATPCVDLLKMFQQNSGAFFDSSNIWTIDVFPNMIPIIMYVIMTSIRQFKEITDNTFSKVSVPSICMYYMSIVYGFFLINDLEVRPASSAHAHSWKNDEDKKEFVMLLKSLPIPERLIPILSQFFASETDRTKNVFFVPSAAGYDHDQFFGRVFPMNFFSEIHDCIANIPSSTPTMQITQYLFSRPLYTAGDFTCVIPDLIGVSLDRTTVTTANYTNSKLYQVYNCLFNPVLFRNLQHRQTFAALSLQPPGYDSTDLNAYDMMFSATPDNLRELTVVLNTIAAVLSQSNMCKDSLADFIASSSGISIMSHGYTKFMLPTWVHNQADNKVQNFGRITTMNSVTSSARATDICFLQRPAAALTTTVPVTDVTYTATADPATVVPLPDGHSLVRHFPGSLRAQVNAELVFPNHNAGAFATFSEYDSVVPIVLVLDVEGNHGLNAYLATLTGKVIESLELDGTVIDIPSTDRSVGTQNSMFADSAIPYKYVRAGTAYYPQAAGSVIPPLDRVPHTPSTRMSASSLLIDRNKVLLPKFQSHIHAALGVTLPGMTTLSGVVSAPHCQSFIGLRTCDRSAFAAADDEVPAMTENRLYVWSPYTFTPYESSGFDDIDYANIKHYYLTNLRSIFGTDCNLVAIPNAYKAFPVA